MRYTDIQSFQALEKSKLVIAHIPEISSCYLINFFLFHFKRESRNYMGGITPQMQQFEMYRIIGFHHATLFFFFFFFHRGLIRGRVTGLKSKT